MRLSVLVLLLTLPNFMHATHVVRSTAPPGFCMCTSEASEWSPWRTYNHEWPELPVKWSLDE